MDEHIINFLKLVEQGDITKLECVVLIKDELISRLEPYLGEDYRNAERILRA